MMRSLFAGVSGLRTHQVRMDVLGNNISNVNTTGFKASRVTFTEIFNQTISGATRPTAGRGGINPQQVGLGNKIGSVDVIHEQGNLQTTGKTTDMAVQGRGFFIVASDGQRFYTRAGAFDLDGEGYLVNPATGMRVQGWSADTTGAVTVDPTSLSDIRIPLGENIAAEATTEINYIRNLDAAANVGDTITTTVSVVDSRGVYHTMSMDFTNTAPNAWDWQVDTALLPGYIGGGNGTLSFDVNGNYLASTGGPIQFQPTGSAVLSVAPDFSSVTGYGGASSIEVGTRDGYPTGTLESFTVDATGMITGVFAGNGITRVLGQVGLASFSNPGGLLKQGLNLYGESNNSGLCQVGTSSSGGKGSIVAGALEMGNVDLSREFTDMIITQRGFQANSRTITTSDEMLQELVNIKR